MTEPNRLDFIPIFMKGNNAFNAGRFDEALELYKEAFAIHPAYFHLHAMMGRVYLKKDQIDVAIEHLKRSLELKQDQPDTLVRLGKAYEKKGMHVQAEAVYDLLGEIDKKGRYRDITDSKSRKRRRRSNRDRTPMQNFKRGLKAFFGITTKSRSRKERADREDEPDEKEKELLDELEAEEIDD